MLLPAIRQSARLFQGAIGLVFPIRCALCDAPTVDVDALCADCAGTTTFLQGLCCDLCGAPLPGESSFAERCDDCMSLARPWSRGKSAILYAGAGRRLVLKLKHADRPDLARLASRWIVDVGSDALSGRLLVPVPVHWSRRISRRYNQSAELSRWIAKRAGQDYAPLGLTRLRSTQSQDRKTVEQRFQNVEGSIEGDEATLKNERVCLVDDVMTSGATLSTCARAALDAGAKDISVLVLARVTKPS